MNPAIVSLLLAMIPQKHLAELVVIIIRQIIDSTPTDIDNKIFDPVLARLQEMLKED
jgi:hypothetical protein